MQLNSRDEKHLIEINSTIAEALMILNLEDMGYLFLHDDMRLIASLTDGDVRRAMLKGKSLNSSLLEIANTKPVSIRQGYEQKDLYKLFKNGVSHVPIVDSEGRIVGIANQTYLGVIPISEPYLGEREIQLVNEALKSNWISSAGSYVTQFEGMFCEYIGANYALAVSNGTQALALTLSALGVKPGDEVLVPVLTFGATANAVIQVGARPVFVDIDSTNLGIDPARVKEAITSNTTAIILVHLYGKPAAFAEIQQICIEHNLFLIEDCAEAIGTISDKQHVGSKSDAGTFSFYANKTITTGEGGMVTFIDKSVYEKAKLIRSHGFDPSRRYWHKTWGTNMRMTNLQAAIGVGQTERIQQKVAKKNSLADTYKKLFFESANSNVILYPEIESGLDSHWLYVIKLARPELLEELTRYLTSNRIETRRFFSPLYNQPAFEEYVQEGSNFPVADELYRNSLCLPSFDQMTNEQVAFIVRTISRFSEPIKLR